MTAIEELKHEHRIIERMLAVLRAANDRAEAGQALPPDFFNQVVDFVRNFADKCHHGKEEDNLFPTMELRGVPRLGGPLAVMLEEHRQGRDYVRQMDEAARRLAGGDKSALKMGLAAARGYADLLTAHIAKEDNVLYPMAERVLTPEDEQELLEKFEEIETTRMGPGKHEQYLKMIARLEKKWELK
ncbi:MAG: hemerythrin domain-containing protein [Dehalococcoidales bacterium]|nr:hemerythrin domain-containing protein [Dehalococcoidales bacterium]